VGAADQLELEDAAPAEAADDLGERAADAIVGRDRLGIRADPEIRGVDRRAAWCTEQTTSPFQATADTAVSVPSS
jgi:hypothetical protein